MLRRLAEIPERRPGWTIAAIGLFFVVAYAVSLVTVPKRGGRLVVGDAVHYYVYLRSAVFDRDLHFRNEYLRIYGLDAPNEETHWIDEPTATGHVRNMMSIGPPLAWAPLFLATTGIVAAARLLGSTYPLDGFGWAFQASAGLSGILAAALGAWIAFRLTARLFDRRLAIWSALTVWLASSAVYYSVISPTYSHAVSMLAVGLFFDYWVRTIDRQTPRRYAVVGALAGLVSLVRWQDAVFLIVPIVDAVYQAVRVPDGTGGRSATARWRAALTNLAACGGAALVAFSPQAAVFMILYGQPLAMPQGGHWMQWFDPKFGAVLFSSWHGLLTWTPVILLALAGLVPLARRHRVVALAMGAAFLVSLYANAAVIEWWAGEAFGSRRFVSCLPIFVVGFAALAERARPTLARLASSAVVLVGLNVLLLLQYQVYMKGWVQLAAYPKGWYDLFLERFVVPFRILEWLWTR